MNRITEADESLCLTRDQKLAENLKLRIRSINLSRWLLGVSTSKLHGNKLAFSLQHSDMH